MFYRNRAHCHTSYMEIIAVVTFTEKNSTRGDAMKYTDLWILNETSSTSSFLTEHIFEMLRITRRWSLFQEDAVIPLCRYHFSFHCYNLGVHLEMM